MSAKDTNNGEWGRKNRKEEDRLRGLHNKARREAIEEQYSSFAGVFLPLATPEGE